VTTPNRLDAADLPGPAPQAFAVVGGMAAWGVALLTAYPVVQIACSVGQPLLVHLVRWTATLIALTATLTGRHVYRRARAAEPGPDDPVVRERIQRTRFLGFGGMLVSATGVLLLVVEDLATWVIDPCL
jgi:hypothetical protein